MSDPTVRETANRNDDEARAEDIRCAATILAKHYLDNHEFKLLAELAEADFVDWYSDRYEDGTYAWFVDCERTGKWKCNNVEVDTEAVAEAFVDWIGD